MWKDFEDKIKEVEFHVINENPNAIKVTDLIKCSRHKSHKDYIKMVTGIYAEEGVRNILQGSKGTYEIVVDDTRIIGSPDIEKNGVIEVKAGRGLTTLVQGVLQASMYAYMTDKPTFLYIIGLAVIKIIPMSIEDIRKMINSRTLPRSDECNSCIFKLTCSDAYNYILNWRKYIDEVRLIDHNKMELVVSDIDTLLRKMREERSEEE